MSNDNKWKEYDYIFKLEQELNKTRWMVFTALLSVSFIIGGLVLKEAAALGPLLTKSGMVFGWLIFMAGVYHYWWFHKKAHDLRDRMCELEEELSIEVFKIRTRRPKCLGIKIFYHWAINVLALAYTLILVLVLLQ
jgi:hypothetical protein